MKTTKEVNPMIKVAVDELERLHQVLTHPNSSVDLKAWAARNIGRIHDNLFIINVEVQKPFEFREFNFKEEL